MQVTTYPGFERLTITHARIDQPEVLPIISTYVIELGIEPLSGLSGSIRYFQLNLELALNVHVGLCTS